MTQAERDRLVTLRKAQKKLIRQKQAAAELGITDRQVCRLLKKSLPCATRPTPTLALSGRP